MKKVIKNIVIAVLAVLLVLVMVHSCVADNMNMHVEETGTGVKLVVTYNQKQYEVALTPVQNTATPNTNTGAAAQSTVPQTQTNTAPQSTQPAAGTAVTLEQAKTIALNDAGVSQAQFIKTKQDFDDGRQVYEIDFIANNREYEYDIDCATGRIIKADTDLYFSLQSNSGSTAQNNTAASTVITSAEAENIALKDAGVAKANVNYIHSHNDSDDGIVVYDVEFVANGTKYEYSIRRDNGAIIDKDVERR